MMKALVLKTYRITDIQFQNHAAANGKAKLETKYTYQVKFGNNNTCRAEMKVSVSDKENPDTLMVDMTMVGIFEIVAEQDKELLHKESFKQLYPFARAAVSTISSSTGILPIIIPDVDIDNQDIYRYNPELFSNK
ncbi:MAG: protein-export chaperone SecB [Clostridia bacterium]|nr:protein-export chaperone SecB [Clostridia bacterium]